MLARAGFDGARQYLRRVRCEIYGAFDASFEFELDGVIHALKSAMKIGQPQ